MRDTGVDWFRISWSSSRTIERALNREALCYAKGFGNLIVMFKKRGGYLAYHIGTMGLGTNHKWSTANQLDVLKCFDLLKDIKDKGTGIVYLPDGLEDEVREHIMIERL